MAPIPTKKIFQTPSEPIVETIQATAIVVLHPGSMFLRIGRPTDLYPTTIPHVIARRCKAGFQAEIGDYLVPNVTVTREASACVEETLRSTQRLLSSCLTSDGTVRYVGSPEKIYEFNEKSKPIIDGTCSFLPSTSVPPSEEVLVGDEALSLADGEPFHISWPLRRGKLNLRNGPGGSITAVLADLGKIWSTAIEKHLDIPLKDLSHYRAVLVVPDVYNRLHVKEMVNVLLNSMKFGGCFVHVESVCATFGAGLSYAVVIDVGDQTTSVSCVEDGISHRKTRLCMEYGGSDLTQFFHFLLNRNYFPYPTCDSRIQMDAILLRELKEKFCHVNLDICGQHERSFTIKQPGKPVISYAIMLGDDCLLAPLALFTPDILALTGVKKTLTLKINEGDPEDPHDENFLIQTQRRGVKEPSDTGPQSSEFGLQMGLAGDDCNQEEDLDVTSEGPTNNPTNPVAVESDIQCNQLYGIDQAVLQSIERCDSDDLKRKMFSCILVVGGGAMFLNLSTFLRNRLAVQTPLNYRGEQLDIVVRPKDNDPRITVWKGASVMSCLDTAQELWISRKEWKRYGVKILRERAPFTW